MSWKPIKTAPSGENIMIKTLGGRIFEAIYCHDAALDENEKPCGQWQAIGDNYPECWSEGSCWESNEHAYPLDTQQR